MKYVARRNAAGRQRVAGWIASASASNPLERMKALNLAVHSGLRRVESKSVPEQFGGREFKSLFRRRSAEEIAGSGKSLGCSEYAKVLVYSLRRARLPGHFELVETYAKEQPVGRGNTHGHVVIKAEIGGQTYYLDPSSNKFYGPTSVKSFEEIDPRYVEFGRGLSFTRLGTDSWEGQLAARDRLIKERKIRRVQAR